MIGPLCGKSGKFYQQMSEKIYCMLCSKILWSYADKGKDPPFVF
jgi:hypothetical protein